MFIPDNISHVLSRLRDAGYEAYTVGGCVRDTLLGLVPHDWDVCTSALPHETEAVFSELRCIETGIRHGTVTVLSGGVNVEVTTFRRDGIYLDGRRPENVTFTTSLTEDLSRRDFTCNAMAWDGAGTIIDPFRGQDDLRQGILRCVGDPVTRFREDALRILRALRFASRFGFSLDSETAAAVHDERELLHKIAQERVYSELCGIISAPHAASVLPSYQDVLSVVLPESEALSSEEFSRRLMGMQGLPEGVALRFSALLRDPISANSAMLRLRADNLTRRTVVSLCDSLTRPLPATRPQLRRLVAALGPSLSTDALLLFRSYAVSDSELLDVERSRVLLSDILSCDTCFSVRDLAVDGQALLSVGAEQGPSLGRLLSALLDAVFDERCPNDTAALLAYARRLLSK